LSKLTPTYSGRDLQQIVSKAVLSAVKRSGNSGGGFKLEEWDFELLARHYRAVMENWNLPDNIDDDSGSESIYPW